MLFWLLLFFSFPSPTLSLLRCQPLVFPIKSLFIQAVQPLSFFAPCFLFTVHRWLPEVLFLVTPEGVETLFLLFRQGAFFWLLLFREWAVAEVSDREVGLRVRFSWLLLFREWTVAEVSDREVGWAENIFTPPFPLYVQVCTPSGPMASARPPSLTHICFFL